MHRVNSRSYDLHPAVTGLRAEDTINKRRQWKELQPPVRYVVYARVFIQATIPVDRNKARGWSARYVCP